MNNQIHIRLSDAEMDALDQYVKESGLLQQDVVVAAIRQLINQRNREKNKRKCKFTFIDLFAGIGGMRLAYESIGGKCVYSSEWDRYCQQTYFANFGDQPEGDITKVNENDIPDHDVLVAGFPCQPFSIAGVSKKNSLGRATGFEDKTQGTLFFDVCRIIKAKRPKAFMLENVKNLTSHDHGNTFKVIKESLDELNYQVFYAILDGQNFVPQHRERIIIVGFDKERYGDSIDFEFKLKPVEPKPVLADILEKHVDEKYTLSDHLWDYLQKYAAKHKAAGNGFGYGLAYPTGITRTLSARYYKDGSEILIPQKGKNPRRLTPRECARLQGYPDTYIIPVSDTRAYKQFGNSVVVPLMANVATLVVSKVKKLDNLSRRNAEDK
jgi:DNA (cytosine-5)-methyltransferase 1